MTRPAFAVSASLAPAEASSSIATNAHEAFVWPAWGIALLGGLCVLIGLTYFVVRLRRAATRRDNA